LRVPVVPQGARTGLSGAANASDGCIVLSLVKINAFRAKSTPSTRGSGCRGSPLPRFSPRQRVL
ncbi:hypothetical protein ABZ504_37180, partial [Streptomyces mirabilis]|uniref:hypothetical protein n=1 Tax=Streptomyces mirabilis TaxID=68239 RepID=UPI0033CAA1DB